jgi:hypothetical protein
LRSPEVQPRRLGVARAGGRQSGRELVKNGDPRFREDRHLELNSIDRRLELSAVELCREVAGNFHASPGLGDRRFQPLFHDCLLIAWCDAGLLTGLLMSRSKRLAMGQIERVTGRCSTPHLNNTFSLWNACMRSRNSVQPSSSEPTGISRERQPGSRARFSFPLTPALSGIGRPAAYHGEGALRRVVTPPPRQRIRGSRGISRLPDRSTWAYTFSSPCLDGCVIQRLPTGAGQETASRLADDSKDVV